jgi:hypothetical protein
MTPRRYQQGFGDPATLPEFLGIAALMRQGSKRSRLRRLAIVCAKAHTLAELFGAGDRAVLLVGEKEAAPLRELPAQSPEPFFPGGPREDLSITLLCRCREVSVTADWIKGQLAHGRTRVRVDPPIPSLRF